MANEIYTEVGGAANLSKRNEKLKAQLAALGGQLSAKHKYPQLRVRGNVIHDEEKKPMRIDNQGILSKPFKGQNIQAQVAGGSIAAVGLEETLS
ncbi:hypothetical protein [Kitasatospora sp. NPDC092286]|uniref:hypothetical protein n=1 Tax=Kitasatospora sp. NPDC092286 TaxID=3364087 RepID=UPI00382C8514